MTKVIVALAALLLLVACTSSGGGDTASPGTGPATTSSLSPAATGTTGEPAVREISVAVDGRTIAGQCEGEPSAGAPTVVLDSGMGNDRTQLRAIGDALLERTMVCSYDRAGYGASDPPASLPRPITDVVEDLHAFLSEGDVPAPYFLIGHSQGGGNVLLFSVEHPDEVAGFVAMNPGAPCSLYLRTVAEVMSRDELQAEVENCEGQNPEGIDLRSQSAVLRTSLPPSMPYAVMYAFNCAGDDFCERVRPVELRDEAVLADLGEGGRFVEVKGADHEIWLTDMDIVLQTIDDVWADATD
ncbi:MAG: lysophospholipase [Actinomycetota bacterium]|nr:lysophospholipase [Actinomycetota bacterium]